VDIYNWADDIEGGALEQAFNIAKLPFAFHHVAVMADGHQGFGMPIGGVLATRGVIVPNAVGVDIGCGMAAVRTNLFDYDLQPDALKQVMAIVRGTVPLGLGQRQAEPQDWEGFDRAPRLFVIQRQLEAARKQLGTLGAGNHFIEIQAEEHGPVWVMVHSGSRNFGLQVAGEYHKAAKVMCERWHSKIPTPDLAFLPIETLEGKDYLEGMGYCLEFARENRAVMMRHVIEALDQITGAVRVVVSLDVHHNYARWEQHYGQSVLVHRKGATYAGAGSVGIIPGSMGTASYIVRGLGSQASFDSCSHGAGRRMSRTAARRDLDLNLEQAKMTALGVVGGPRTAADLDEAPGAYKDIDVVMAAQRDLVEVSNKLRPLASLKG
jgi:tRNA-splicing ligase RtcB